MFLLGLFALVQELGYLFLLFFSPYLDQNFQWLPLYLSVWVFLFIIYFLSLNSVKKQILPQINTENQIHRWVLFVILSGLVFRLTALFIENLVLSHDLYLYVWYGRLQSHGYNPYLYTAMDSALEYLRDDLIWSHIAFKHILPIYPALLMKLFHFAYLIGGDSLIGFKILQFIPELAIMLLGIKLLRFYGKNPLWIIVYAWCPLPILEYIGMGHSDTWGIASLLLAVLLFEKKRQWGAGAALALSVLIKVFPILLFPAFFFRMSWRERFQFAVGFAITLVICYLPFISAHEKLLGVLPTFMQNYQFNGSIYQIFDAIFGNAGRAHLAANLLIVATALILALRKQSLFHVCFYTLLVFFLLSYQVFPWYLGYLLPFLLVVRSWGANTWLLTCILSYYILLPYRMGKGWHELPWILLVEYIPVYALFLAQTNRSWQKVGSTKVLTS